MGESGAIRILGLDPGSYACGVAVVALIEHRVEPIAYDTIRQPRSSAKGRKLDVIYRGVVEFIERFAPDVAAIEKVFTAFNPATAVKLGEARGVALLAMEQAGLDIYPYAATKVKKAVVGYGHADKSQVQQMVQHALALPQQPPADAADALAIALCHAATVGVVANASGHNRVDEATVSEATNAPTAARTTGATGRIDAALADLAGGGQ